MDSEPIGLGAVGEIAITYVEDFQLRAIETSPYLRECQSAVDWGDAEIVARERIKAKKSSRRNIESL